MKHLYNDILKNAKENDSYVLRNSLTKFIKLNLSSLNELMTMMSMVEFCKNLSEDTGIEVDLFCFRSAYRRARQHAEKIGAKKSSLEHEKLAPTKDEEEPKEKASNQILVGSNHSSFNQETDNISCEIVSEIERNLNEIGLDRMTVGDVVNSGVTWEELCQACPQLSQKSPLLKTTHGSNIRSFLRKRQKETLMATLKNN